MTYTVFLSHQAEKFYKKLKKNIRARVREALTILESTLRWKKAPWRAKAKLQHAGRKNQNNLHDLRKRQNHIHNCHRTKKNNLPVIAC